MTFSVGVQCMTYNHSKYILDALNGFVMQETDFPFIILLVDDASTDDNSLLIKDYLIKNFRVNDHNTAYEKETDYAFISYAQHNSNLNCFIAAIYLKYNHYQIGKKMEKLEYLSEWLSNCKYVALCEGDDYWTDPQKLQNQVAFMEGNKEYSLCFHNANIIYEGTDRAPKSFTRINEDCDVTFNQLTSSWIIPTASILFKRDIMDSFPDWMREIYSGDLTLSLIAYNWGRIRYLNKNMSIYRINFTGNSASAFVLKQSAGYIQEQHIKLYSLFDEYSSYKYHDAISLILKRLNKELDFQRKLRRSLFVAFIYHPLQFIIALKNKISSLINPNA